MRRLTFVRTIIAIEYSSYVLVLWLIGFWSMVLLSTILTVAFAFYFFHLAKHSEREGMAFRDTYTIQCMRLYRWPFRTVARLFK